MQKRRPVVAGQFYPGQQKLCLNEIKQCLEQRTLSQSLPESIVAGIVPHAGWMFSGSLAALVFSAIKQRHEKVDTFILFGAAHSYFGRMPAVCATGYWITPLGEINIDEQLAVNLLNTGHVADDPDAHSTEHSIEVQVPFIQHLFAGASILPIVVPPGKEAIPLGTAVGDIISRDKQKKYVCIGSTDLTHYGPRYDFAPMGIGREALKWAGKVNDRKFINLALQIEPQKMLASAAKNYNACGPGAAAAAVAAAKKLGKNEGLLLAYTNSSEVMLEKMGTESEDSVGYAAIIF